MSDTIYCVYLTTYFGDRLPKYYIGSSSVDKVSSGYKGSVLSKKYKHIWNKELKENPDLFQTEILSTWETREEALIEELRQQKEKDVVKSQNYANESFAQVNGFYGRNVSGENNPMFGLTKDNSEIVKQKSQTISNNKKKSKDEKLITKAKNYKITTADVNDRVRRTAETQNGLSVEQRKTLIELRDSGLTYGEIGKIFNSNGIKIRDTSLYRIYDREKIKLYREN